MRCAKWRAVVATGVVGRRFVAVEAFDGGADKRKGIAELVAFLAEILDEVEGHGLRGGADTEGKRHGVAAEVRGHRRIVGGDDAVAAEELFVEACRDDALQVRYDRWRRRIVF